MPTTQRLLTDETGQALVTAINNIVAAVKPNATEIQMSSSDTTTVAEAISTTNQALLTVRYPENLGAIDSISALSGKLDTALSSLDNYATKPIKFNFTANASPFVATVVYTGAMYKPGGELYANAIVYANSSPTAILCYRTQANGWRYEQVALKSDLSPTPVTVLGWGSYGNGVQTISNNPAANTLVRIWIGQSNNYGELRLWGQVSDGFKFVTEDGVLYIQQTSATSITISGAGTHSQVRQIKAYPNFAFAT